MRTRVSTFLGEALIAGILISLGAANAQTPAPTAGAASPIQHLVVIFQENISFDHYFGTYPFAMNPGRRTGRSTPTPIRRASTASVRRSLAAARPCANSANGSGATAPFRLDRSQAATADQDHDYTAEQIAYHSGLVDLFPMATGTAGPPPSNIPQAPRRAS